MKCFKSALLIFLLLSPHAWSSDFLYISDFSQVKWQLASDGKVYFRNLDVFDSSYLGCCYNYYIDTTTDAGKAFFTAFLALHTSGKPGHLGMIDKSQAGPVSYIGRW